MYFCYSGHMYDKEGWDFGKLEGLRLVLKCGSTSQLFTIEAEQECGSRFAQFPKFVQRNQKFGFLCQILKSTMQVK